jgi:hypothetical protein
MWQSLIAKPALGERCEPNHKRFFGDTLIWICLSLGERVKFLLVGVGYLDELPLHRDEGNWALCLEPKLKQK